MMLLTVPTRNKTMCGGIRAARSISEAMYHFHQTPKTTLHMGRDPSIAANNSVSIASVCTITFSNFNDCGYEYFLSRLPGTDWGNLKTSKRKDSDKKF